MVELGGLESRQQDFASRNVRVFAISNDDVDTAKLTQEKFPHLTIISDPQQTMAKALAVQHEGAGMNGEATNAPTTFLVKDGTIRWMFRPDRFLERLPAADVLTAIDTTLNRP